MNQNNTGCGMRVYDEAEIEARLRLKRWQLALAFGLGAFGAVWSGPSWQLVAGAAPMDPERVIARAGCDPAQRFHLDCSLDLPAR